MSDIKSFQKHLHVIYVVGFYALYNLLRQLLKSFLCAYYRILRPNWLSVSLLHNIVFLCLLYLWQFSFHIRSFLLFRSQFYLKFILVFGWSFLVQWLGIVEAVKSRSLMAWTFFLLLLIFFLFRKIYLVLISSGKLPLIINVWLFIFLIV